MVQARRMPVALVTGSGVRLGRAIALELAGAGYDLLLHANRSVEAVRSLRDEIAAVGRNVSVLQADLSTSEGQDALAREAARQAGALDVLVNNAGLFEKIPFEEVGRETWRRMLSVNLEAPYFLVQALLPSLRRAPSPCVVNLTDIGGERPTPGYSHYSITKAGLLMLTRTLAAELAPQVRVNAVSPGTVVFPEDFDDVTRAEYLARIPMRREGSAEDVARAVVFLVRDAPYVTGQAINVDGGRSSVL